MTEHRADDSLRYDRTVDLGFDDSLSEIAKLIRASSTVLDLGAATGALGKHLSAQGCAVDGVELEAEAAARARPHYRRLLQLDLEAVDLRDHFSGAAYDAIVCADVLEHLRDPGRVLDQLAALLAPGGRVLLSIPNVGYAGVVADLLSGEFRYRPTGLLDRTHLRFFTRTSLIELLREHGFRASSFSTIQADPRSAEFGEDRLRALPPAVLRTLLAQPDSLAYQFIVEAEPGSGISTDSPQPPPGLRFGCQVYWSSDGAYDERLSATASGRIGEARQNVEIVLPPMSPPPGALRLDPSDRPGFITFHAMRLFGADGRELWTWDGQPRSLHPSSQLVAFNGGSDTTWVATGDDPWFKLPVPPAALARLSSGGKLLVEMSWPMSADYALAREVVDAHERRWESERATLLESMAKVEPGIRKLEQRVQSLTEQSNHLTNHLQMLAERMAALEKGPLLQRVARRARRELRPRVVRFRAVPGNEVRALDASRGEWEATGSDPYFLLLPDGDSLATGWTEIEIELAHSLDTALPPMLYVDVGGGFSESRVLNLPEPKNGHIRTILRLPPWIGALRFDPIDVAGRFRLGEIRMRELGKVRAAVEIAAPSAREALKEPQRIPRAMLKTVSLVRAHGFAGVKSWLREKAQATSGRGNYQEWVEQYDRLSEDDRRAIARRIEELPVRPRFSVLMPVYDTPEPWLRLAIESVRDQLYPDWELCIADDLSTQPHVRAVLDEYARRDARIKVAYRASNGHISAASNSALELASGDFVALLDHDDELAPQALYFLAEEIAAHPDADFLYSDEDKIDEKGERFDPHFKPDWDPDLLASQNYVAHLAAFRTALVRRIGGFRTGVEGSQDHDLCLRVSAASEASRIRHVPHVLYHWRAIGGSTAAHAANKDYAAAASIKALQDRYGTVDPRIRVEAGPLPLTYRLRWPLPPEPPLVSLLIPTRDGYAILSRAIESIRQKTAYPRYEIVVVDNQSRDPQTLGYFDELSRNGHARVVRWDHPFNFSAINNFAVRQARGELIGLINNDIEAIEPEWLDEMVSHALRPDVGCVGAKLLYPDDTVQHAGVMLGYYGVAGHTFRHLLRDSGGYFSRARIVHRVSAVTAACVVLRRSIYEQVGGLDEDNLAIAFNDIDFCLRVREAGYHNVWTPFALLSHHESASRGLEDTPEKRERFARECDFMKRRWGRKLLEDPYYNPNLSLRSEHMDLAWPPRARKPWQRRNGS